jgi:hypothetical protein
VSKRSPVIYATRRALEQAVPLLGGGVLENRVEEMIQAGCSFKRGPGRAVVLAGEGWKATLERCDARTDRSRPAWKVTGVSRLGSDLQGGER